ncbi:MAG: Ribonuclease J 2 [candidate division WS2 bacterium]|nr:Ribonuclease J 2 [Candidatus Lithacetigena glycinireducens]MBT9175253.1 Ribonuclease J 2 [Candidatus Lithacetigena glycinireducens]
MNNQYPNITCFGGTGMIGGNQFFLQDEDARIMLDFGIPFKIRENYFEEFLKPRTAAGLEDYLKTGIIPPIEGIYRHDLLRIHQMIRGDNSLSLHQEPDYDLLLLSHAHVDHSGHIPLLDPGITVACSEMTRTILKVMSTVGQSGLESDYIEFRVRSEEGKMSKKESEPRIPRSFHLYNKENPFFQNERVLAHPVDHSIPGATAYIIRTSKGLVVYTGDFRAHGIRKEDTFNFVSLVEKLKLSGEKVLALLIEGTTLQREDISKQYSEEDVRTSLYTLMKSHPLGLILVDFGPRNVERLVLTVEAAQSAGRKVLLRLPDAYLLREIHKVNPAFPDPSHPEVEILMERRSSDPRKWEKEIIIEYKNKLVTPFELRKNPDKYVVLFSFFDINEVVDFNLSHGTFIYSSSEAYTEEQKFDLKRLRNWLKLFNFEFVGDPDNKDFNLPLHVTGHAYPDTIKEVIQRIEPQILIPIHTEKPEKFIDIAPLSRVLIPVYGETLYL